MAKPDTIRDTDSRQAEVAFPNRLVRTARRIRQRWHRIVITGQLGPVGERDAVRDGPVRF
jgi:hypothetical protein